jgi:hypothetical protein
MMNGTNSSKLWFLADIFILVFPATGFASIGDLVLGLGMTLAVQHGMARYSVGKHVRGSHLQEYAHQVEERGVNVMTESQEHLHANEVATQNQPIPMDRKQPQTPDVHSRVSMIHLSPRLKAMTEMIEPGAVVSLIRLWEWLH